MATEYESVACLWVQIPEKSHHSLTGRTQALPAREQCFKKRSLVFWDEFRRSHRERDQYASHPGVA